MLKKFEKEYLALYKKLQKQQWANYFETSDYDLSLLDKKIYQLVCSYADKIKISTRKGQIANFIIKREQVDKAPNVSKLRNRIDNLANYSRNIAKEIRKDSYNYKLELAKRMKEDVLRLMDIRNSLATKNGYNSYVDLALATEEVDKESVIKLLNSFLDKNLNKAQAIINKYDISFKNWFKDLARISKTNKNYNPSKVIDTLLKMFSYREIKEKIEINCIKDGFGYAVETSPNNIKIVIKEIESLNGLRTLFHELGHAIFYSLNEEQGLFRVLPASLDESLAVVFETIAANLFLTGEEKEKVSELITLEYTRCAISALFEFDLWQKPNQAEQLYKKHYNKLGLEICDPNIWARDSFRSIDPVYIHNYVIGASIANKLMRYLKQLHSNNYAVWGSWLYNNLYHDGRRRKLSEKINVIED